MNTETPVLVTAAENPIGSPGVTSRSSACSAAASVGQKKPLTVSAAVIDAQLLAPGTHAPEWHASPVVHAFPSSHAVPSAFAGFEQAPVCMLHAPAAWH
jgi:hypothetical protein